jgi:hypothetical protein
MGSLIVSDETPVSKDALPLSGNTEIELKLAVDAKGLAQVRRTAFWSGPVRAQPRCWIASISAPPDTICAWLRPRSCGCRMPSILRPSPKRKMEPMGQL